ncbi:hypothetical protein K443DRAFT_89016 [Laccaria amethystina LaAM-08-1]|uniref:Transcriptional regulatory protein n=1 Tax=Laccaria amethystina LaAM-08-1 TaxID=1095629 RepID=A0A0C9XXX8_9AGAR|nr:hypothetical protein K443DRAFT_89016 [Laccaria amethystina LaAM-08-1]
MFNSQLRIVPSLYKRLFSVCNPNLSGHNKWSKIKDRKGNNDLQKSLLYGNANRDILVAARAGGSADPSVNIQLSTILKKYKEQGVPKENIEKALARARRGKEKGGDSVMYEALAFNSVGLMIECLTDNPTRTIHKIRHTLTNHRHGTTIPLNLQGARLTPVQFMFQRRGLIELALNKSAEERIEQLIDLALTNGADDFDDIVDEDTGVLLKFSCSPLVFAQLSTAIASHTELWSEIRTSELTYVPLETVEPSEDLKSQLNSLTEELEADEDTLRVWTTLGS